MFRLNPNSRRLKNDKRGFSLVELIVVILIIAILAVAVFAGGSAAIKKAQKARAISDLHNFQIAVAMTMNKNPQIANIEAATRRDKLSAIMDALNANLPAVYKVTLQTAAMDGNISMAAQTNVNADFIICKSEKTDAWDNPYFVIIDSAQRGGSALSEFYMTTVSAGPNAILNLTSEIDKDDVFDLTSYADGDVKSEIYDIAEAAPTVVSGTAAATSFTDPAAAPVNNGETTTFPEPGPEPTHYSISATVTNGTYDGDTTIDENGNATVTIAASAGYQLPNSVTVTGATSSYNETTGVVTLSNPTGNVSITATCPALPTIYSVTTTVTNGTYTGATSINENGNATVTISVSAGYRLPDSVTVTGAEYSYNSSTGIISLTSPTDDVSVVVSCSTIPAGSLIVFTIDGTEFQAEYGMAWESWVNTEYNTIGAVRNKTYIRIDGKGVNKRQENDVLWTVNSWEIITPNGVYLT